MKIILALLLAAATLLAADDWQNITTADGKTIKVSVKELRPDGVVFYRNTGTTFTIPYAKLPKELQARYGYDAEELAKYLKQGLDGTYNYREDVMAFAGEVFEIKNGEFTYSTFTDVFDPNDHRRPVHGRFAVVGNWLVMRDPKLGDLSRIIVVIDERIALLTPPIFQKWKETGRLSKTSDALYQQKPK